MIEYLDVLIIGNLAFDKILLKETTVTVTGGAAFYSSVGARLFNAKVGIVSRIGKDYPIKEIKGQGILSSGIKTIKEKSSDIFYSVSTLSNKINGSIKDEVDIGKNICFEDIPQEFLKAKYIHVATMNPNKQLKIINKIKLNSNAKISLGVCREFILKDKEIVNQAIKLSDLVFLNDSEYPLVSLEGKNFILTKGELGASASIDGSTFFAEAPSVSVIDTIGCGDVLAGAFLGQISQSVKIEKAIQSAVNLASRKAEGVGVRKLVIGREDE